MSIRLSKSQFVRGLQCTKSLWLYKHSPERRTLPGEQQQARFDEGTRVGLLAQQLFPGGTELSYSPGGLAGNIRKTKNLIASGVTTIYEATFQYDTVLVMVDILHKTANGWEIYEVKASTSVKEPIYINDLSIQYYVLSGSGLHICKTSIVHINNQYERVGELEINKLFNISDQTDAVVSNLHYTESSLNLLKSAVNETTEPDILIGKQCSSPYECDFKTYCWGAIPDVSVFSLTRLSSERKFQLYHDGIVTFDQLPEDVHLTEAQQIQVTSHLKNKQYINKEGISDFLDQLNEPIGFLDCNQRFTSQPKSPA